MRPPKYPREERSPMIRARRILLVLTLAVLILAGFAINPPRRSAVVSPITLIGKGLIDANGQDKSGLKGNICQAAVPTNCVSKSIVGGFGSALAYTGFKDVYIGVPDRGPFDGLTNTPYLDRFHFLQIKTNLGAPFPNIQTTLLATRFLKNKYNQNFVGAAVAFGVPIEANNLRLDPEGVRVGPNGTFFISDEYGPFLLEFDPERRLLHRIPVPDKFFIADPDSDPNVELLGNTSGRQANRGMEGLAISPDGNTLFGIMQNALFQDHGLNPGTTDRLGLNNRILKMNLLSGETHEYVYILDAINRGQGVSEILA